MGYRDHYKAPLRDYHRDPFPHSLPRTRQTILKPIPHVSVRVALRTLPGGSPPDLSELHLGGTQFRGLSLKAWA